MEIEILKPILSFLIVKSIIKLSFILAIVINKEIAKIKAGFLIDYKMC